MGKNFRIWRNERELDTFSGSIKIANFNFTENSPPQGLSEARRGREFFGVFFYFTQSISGIHDHAWTFQKVDLKISLVTKK